LIAIGEVYRYSYLWAREAEAGEESGRKDRPACVLVRPSTQPELIFLYPITSMQPSNGRIAELMPAPEARRCGLTSPTWVVLDEYNIAAESGLHDFASLKPLGTLSSPFIRLLLGKALTSAKNSRSRGVLRN
jgi:hypothetical protein